jgi:hypothetical protein
MRNVEAARPVPTKGFFSFLLVSSPVARRWAVTRHEHLAVFRRRVSEVDRARAGRLLGADPEARRAPFREGLPQLVREAVIERRARVVAVGRQAAEKR